MENGASPAGCSRDPAARSAGDSSRSVERPLPQNRWRSRARLCSNTVGPLTLRQRTDHAAPWTLSRAVPRRSVRGAPRRSGPRRSKLGPAACRASRVHQGGSRPLSGRGDQRGVELVARRRRPPAPRKSPRRDAPPREPAAVFTHGPAHSRLPAVLHSALIRAARSAGDITQKGETLPRAGATILYVAAS
jgi:hypothetical protein